MSHLDEGTLHALLDGELEITEVKEIQAHLGSCAACGSRLKEVREFLAESDRLVAAVEFPGTLRPRPDTFAPDAAASESAPQRPPLRQRAAARRAEPDTAPPVLLIPDNPDFDVGGRRWGAFRWAALIAVVAGAGYLASTSGLRGGGPIASLASKESAPAAAPADTGPVVSQEEAPPAETLGKAMANRTEEPAAPPASTRTKANPPKAASPKPAAAPQPKPDKPEEQPQLAAREDSPEEPKDEFADSATYDTANEASISQDAVDRDKAAEAMAELDRERRMERARAATAMLGGRPRGATGSTGRAADAAAPEPPVALVPAPPLAPRTLEQRSQVYLRIGLDEAARQLGRPVHVIEGMSPVFMGLAQGRLSPGADSSRVVVRVVYQDAQGRMILLDQQRLRPGQSAPANEGRWTYGDITLSLFGEVGPEVLRNLRPRVR